MKKTIQIFIDKLWVPLQLFDSIRAVILFIYKVIYYIIHGESIYIKRIKGVWFGYYDGFATPLGNNIQIRIKKIILWSSPSSKEFIEMREKWWFRFYTPNAGDFIIDIGAGMGEDSYVFSKAVGINGIVVAIEAHPTTYNSLSLFKQINSIQNIETKNVAASDKNGVLWISSLEEANWQCNSITSDKELENKVEVNAIRIDDIPIISSRNTVDFIKINIEGAEINALIGAYETLKKTKNICVCCHDFLGIKTRTKNEVCLILENAGFVLSFPSHLSPPYEQDFVYGKKSMSIIANN